jgi:filamentous hemagglutinin family protein
MSLSLVSDFCRRLVAYLVIAGMFMPAAFVQAGPTDAQVTAGAVIVSQSGNTTTVTQSSQNLSINWQSFNIAPQEAVNFVQPSAPSVAVNRIADTNGSQILGQLNANGQVFLINPNGILFGQGAQVNVGGLVASTLGFNDANLNSSARTFSGSGTGSITNQGILNAAQGGYVEPLANTVSNQGTITAPQGSVTLGAGNAATLTFQDNSLVQMQVDQSVLNSMAENGGLIQADGGIVIMNAGAKNALLASVVNNTGVIEARTVDHQPGSIIVLGGMAAGTANISGTLDASAPNGGDGGFIETSAAYVKIADDVKVTTLATDGNSGTWLIDPTDFTISDGSAALSDSGIGASVLNTALGSNNVSIATSAADTGAELGEINIDSAVSWESDHKLTLKAHNNINVNANITATGATASMAFNPGAGALNIKHEVSISLANVTSGSTAALSIGGAAYTIVNDVNYL